MENTKYDLVIIGGGPAGYMASIRAGQLGLKTACIEKRKALGGTCLNVGCIPSKALLESSEHYHQAKTKFQKHGIIVGEISFDLAQMMKRKDTVVRQLSNGIAGLFKKYGAEWISGEASITSVSGVDKTIEVNSGTGTKAITATNVLIATGSEPSSLPFLPFDGKRVISSTEALALQEVPKHLVVIGGGVIGLEMASVWSRLGAKVTVVEFQDHIVPGSDRQMASELYKSLVKQQIEFKLSTKCVGATVSENVVVIEAEDMNTLTRFALEADYVLVSTGRKPYTTGLGLEKAGINTDNRGRISINDRFETSVSRVFAVGDVVAGPMLAHKAEEEGVAVVEMLAGRTAHVNYNAIPAIVYTWPELATVGFAEEELKQKGIEYKVGTFPFLANGRARSMDETEGLAKVISDAKTGKVLGVHILGARAGDMIAEAVAMIELGGTAEQMGKMSHAHPTLSEIMKEAARAAWDKPLNI